MIFRETLGPVIYVDASLTCTTHANTAVDQVVQS